MITPDRVRAERLRMRDLGLCRDCGREVEPGRRMCAEHLERGRVQRRRSRAKKAKEANEAAARAGLGLPPDPDLSR